MAEDVETMVFAGDFSSVFLDTADDKGSARFPRVRVEVLTNPNDARRAVLAGFGMTIAGLD